MTIPSFKKVEVEMVGNSIPCIINKLTFKKSSGMQIGNEYSIFQSEIFKEDKSQLQCLAD